MPAIVCYAKHFPKGTTFVHSPDYKPQTVTVPAGATVFYHDAECTKRIGYVDRQQWDRRRKTIMLNCVRRRVQWTK